MSAVELIIIVVLSACTGALTQRLMGMKIGGFLVCTLLGFAGGALGTWLARVLNLPRWIYIGTDWTSEHFPVVWCLLGTVIVIGLVATIQRSHEREKAKH